PRDCRGGVSLPARAGCGKVWRSLARRASEGRRAGERPDGLGGGPYNAPVSRRLARQTDRTPTHAARGGRARLRVPVRHAGRNDSPRRCQAGRRRGEGGGVTADAGPAPFSARRRRMKPTPTPARLALALLLAGLAASHARAEGPRVAAALQPFVERGTLAGAVVVVASPDKVLTLETVGYSDVAAKTPMREDQLFWIASMSKPMTAAGLMMLVDEGKVRLDDPVEKYLPEFKGQVVMV